MATAYRTACVTGGAGFIGAHLVRALLERGLAVHVVDNLSVGARENVPSGAVLYEADILDSERVATAVAHCDIVFHLAARVAIRASFEHITEDAQCNVAGTASVLRAAQRSGTVRKFLTASSMAVYAEGPGPQPMSEDYRTAPISPYGISKLAAEQLTHCLCAAAGMDSVVLRLFNTYGPGQALSPYVGVVTIFANRLRAGEQPVIFGDGAQCRDFVHVDDVVSGFLHAMDAEVSGATFNIGTGVATTVNEVHEHLRRVLRAPGTARYAPAAPGELRYSVADIARARRHLGYEPAHRFQDSNANVVEEILTGNEVHH